MTRLRSTLLSSAIALRVLSPGIAQSEQSGPPDPARVVINDFAFGPQSLAIPVGTTVVWANRDSEPHTIAAVDGKTFRSPALDEGESFTFSFVEPGTYQYYCTLHPHMTGTITVR